MIEEKKQQQSSCLVFFLLFSSLLVVVVIDTFLLLIKGVAPRAKMNQQRQRRFKSAMEAEKAREALAKRGEGVPDDKDIFDSNAITPGTDFMANLTKHFRYLVQKKMETDLKWRSCKVVFSGHDVPGEGEHKIMEFVRGRKAQPGYNPNEVHCLYGLDADLIMLGLVVHEPHFILLREDVFSQTYTKSSSSSSKKDKSADADAANNNKSLVQKFHLLHLSALREYFLLEFQDLNGKLSFKFDLERIIDDFILMCFFCGNDFLPHMPTLDIKEGAITTLFEIYKQVLPTLDGYLTDKGHIHFDRVQQYISKFGEMEDHILSQRFASNAKQNKRSRRRNHKKVKKESPTGASKSTVDMEHLSQVFESSASLESPNGEQQEQVVGVNEVDVVSSALSNHRTLSSNELRELIDKEEDRLKKDSFGADHLDAVVAYSNVLDFPEPISGQYGLDNPLLPLKTLETEIELESLEPDEENAEDILMSSINEESGEFDFKLWRKSYYMRKMNVDVDNQEQMTGLISSFVEAIMWMYNYYYHKCVSWKWYYPYHYSPIASDLVNLKELSEKVQFDLGTPFYPFEQLLGVLPPKSSKLLPSAYNELILHKQSPISDFYPEVINIDREGTKYDWEGVVLLPFIDDVRLLQAVTTIDQSRLSVVEKERNSFGHPHIFTYDPSITYEFKSTLPGELPDIPKSHVKFDRFEIPQPPNGRFIPRLCDGVKMGSNGLEGFPTLFCRKVCAAPRTVGVCLYAQPSRAPTMTLHLDVEEFNRVHKMTEEDLEETSRDEVERIPKSADEYKHLIGKKVYIGYPYPRLAYVSSLSDENGSFYEGSLNNKTEHDDKEREGFRRECGFHRNVLLRKYGMDIGEVDVLLFVRLFKGMEKGKGGGAYRSFHSEEFAYPAQLLPEEYNPIPDPRFQERGSAQIEVDFPVDSPIIFLSDEYFGLEGVVSGYDKSGVNPRLKLALQAPPKDYQPQYPNDVSKCTSSRYFFLREAASKIGISPRTLGLIIGAIKVELPDGRVAKHNIGLQLRSVKANKRIVGYCKLDFNTQNLDETYYLNYQTGIPMDKPANSMFSTNTTFNWQISDKAVDLVRAYKENFPELFDLLEEKDNIKFKAEDLFPDIKQRVETEQIRFEEAKKLYADRISSMSNWIQSQGYLDLPFLPYHVDLFPKAVMSKLEQAAIDFEQKNKQRQNVYKTVHTTIPTPSIIYKAGDPYPTHICKRGRYSIGNRVITMASTGHVPFGMRGIIVGIEGDYAQVLFDQEFLGGTNLGGRLQTRRGGVCQLMSLLILSSAKQNRRAPSAGTSQSQKQQAKQPQQQKQSNAAKFANMPYEKHFYTSGQPKTSIEALKQEASSKPQVVVDQLSAALSQNAELNKFSGEAAKLLNSFQPVSNTNYNPSQEFKKIFNEGRQRSKYGRTRSEQQQLDSNNGGGQKGGKHNRQNRNDKPATQQDQQQQQVQQQVPAQLHQPYQQVPPMHAPHHPLYMMPPMPMYMPYPMYPHPDHQHMYPYPPPPHMHMPEYMNPHAIPGNQQPPPQNNGNEQQQQ